MTSHQLLKEIEKLELSEKLELVGELWDSIARDNDQLPLPEWQKAELDKRYKEFQNGEQTLHEWETVHKEIRNKHK